MRRGCDVFGCGQAKPCSLHAHVRTKPEHAALYQLRRWRRASKHHLMHYPLCGDRALGAPHTVDSLCQRAGEIREANATDHIVQHAGPSDPKAWDPLNFQSLCATCHGRKSGRERADVMPISTSKQGESDIRAHKDQPYDALGTRQDAPGEAIAWTVS